MNNTSTTTIISPFSLGELDKLGKAYAFGDTHALWGWTQQATKHYEEMKNSLYKLVEEMDYGDEVEEHWRKRICEILQNYDSSQPTIIEEEKE